MRVDPNIPVNLKTAHILCHRGRVELADGTIVSGAELNHEHNGFVQLCRRLDPNLWYVDVLIPTEKDTYEEDQQLFYRLKGLGNTIGIRVQSVLRKTDEVWSNWEIIKRMNSGETLFEEDRE